jgi:chitinase
MRSFPRPAAGLILSGLLALSGTACSATGTASAAPTGQSTAGQQAGGGGSGSPNGASASASASGPEYAPYVSATTASSTDSTGSPAVYNLAFAVAKDNSCTPTWGGTTALDNAATITRIKTLTAGGASVRVSFGGASGTELALACDSATALAAAYAKVLDATGATKADFDIEGKALTDTASIGRRGAAIALLQSQRELQVSYTLPVMPTGLDKTGLAIIESANVENVQFSHINIMAMNYGSTYTGDMADYAEQAATATHDQLVDALGLSDSGAWSGLAVTAMIGVNDVEEETFTLEDAAKLREFAEEKQLGWISMWATYRDHQCDGGAKSTVDESCSSVAQESGAFAKALAG